MRIAPGDPKSLGTVKSAEYSTMYGMFDGFGSHPLALDCTLLPELVTGKVAKQQKNKYDELYYMVPEEVTIE